MTRLVSLLPVFILFGCGGSAVVDPRSYDLGLAAPSATLPPARIASVRAVAPFDSIDMHYRLAYRDAAELGAFANSRWAASPPEMLRKQLLRASGDRAGRCAVDVEIQEFSQVFSSKDASEARIELRAWVRGGGARGWSLSEPNAGAGAAAGAAAFARAANRAVGELGAWIAEQPHCR
jgi:cholesterol transport system auxiliary component